MPQARTALESGHDSGRVAREIDAESRAWRSRVLNSLLIVASIAGLLVAGGSILQAARDSERVAQAVLSLALSAFIVTLALLRQLDYRLRAWGLFVLGYMMAATLTANPELHGAGMVFLVILPAVGVIVLGSRSGLIMVLLSLLLYGTLAVVTTAGLSRVSPMTGGTLTLSRWLSQGLLLGFLLLILVALQLLSDRHHTEELRAARESADELGTARDQLQFRTEELDRYSRLLEVSTRITREVTGLLEPEALLVRAVELIAEQLGIEEAEIYLASEDQSEIRLVAQASARGSTVPARDDVPRTVERAIRVPFRGIPFDEQGPPRELALPLESGGRVVGALYLSSSRPFVSDRDELVVLQAVADQITIALENARLYADAQSSLREIDALYRHYAAEGWQRFLAEQPVAAQRWGSSEIDDDSWQALMVQARSSGAPATGVHAETGRHLLAFPLKLRGVAIGALGFQRPAAAGPWQTADIVAVEAVAARLALISDNLRLLDQAQRRASRERLSSRATAHMRASLDVETVLSTAVGEIAGVLGLAALDLRLVGQDGHGTEGLGGSPSVDGPGIER